VQERRKGTEKTKTHNIKVIYHEGYRSLLHTVGNARSGWLLFNFTSKENLEEQLDSTQKHRLISWMSTKELSYEQAADKIYSLADGGKIKIS